MEIEKRGDWSRGKIIAVASAAVILIVVIVLAVTLWS